MYDPLAVVNSFKEKVLKFKNRSKKKNFVFFLKTWPTCFVHTLINHFRVNYELVCIREGFFSAKNKPECDNKTENMHNKNSRQLKHTKI